MRLPATHVRVRRTVDVAALLVCALVIWQFISLPLAWQRQFAVGAASLVAAMLLKRRLTSHASALALMLLALTATLRYGWWRFTMLLQYFHDEANARLSVDSILMLVLLSAEVYTVVIMLLGFLQISSPLRRRPIPLPLDEAAWPHVDVLIPTYNEPLSLVRYTALAANNIDYPPEKLHVYILDDGGRESFRDFAAEAGIGYIARTEHNHAKAGNINHALRQMESPLVTIFDCDHVPTRSFLQLTVGWFLVQRKLAMLQTPHFFYSPDPFERNLWRYRTIPNEGELFYGVIQDGNDLWNATFFCGSCAVIRRTALDEVGGIATETVTEDAHTSLRMQKRGWNTAYLNLPQAAGLATETLSAHVGQRVRWARGMIQILRTDNPLLGRGMKWTQRLCYFNAMLHFLYAVPRLIFLCSPLIYMLAGRTIIPGYWLTILAYSLPHLVLSSMANSRMQGRHRHSFWNEIYETVLAPYILLPTLLALVNPKLGKFNVTDKGGTLSETAYDRHTAAPTGWLLLLNLLGVCVAPYRFLVTDSDHPGTVISNLIWILFNMVILGVAAAVANEQQQRRTSVRIDAQIPVLLHSAAGGLCTGTTRDISVGGAAIHLPAEHPFAAGDRCTISFPVQTGEATIPANVIALGAGGLRLQFAGLTIAEQETLTCAIYSRANSWIRASEQELDRPMVSLVRVVRLSFTGFHEIARSLIPRTQSGPAARKAAVTAVLLCAMWLMPGHAGCQASSGKLDLSTLPKPLFNPTLSTPAKVHFVFLQSPTRATLRAAAITASWLGVLSGGRPVQIDVQQAPPAQGDNVVFDAGSQLSPAQQPIISLRSNPADPAHAELRLAAYSGEELIALAQAAAELSSRQQLQGESTTIAATRPQPRRQINDAPRWLSTETTTSLWSLSSAHALQTETSTLPPIFFRVPPDLSFGERQTIPLHFTYRYNASPVGPGSMLRVHLNGALVAEISLAGGESETRLSRNVELPVDFIKPFGNTLLFSFDFARRGPVDAAMPLAGAILEDSFVDLRGLAHAAHMPSLKLFAEGGFPFTRQADLAGTTILLPPAPSPGELAVMLQLLLRFGEQTGIVASQFEFGEIEKIAAPDRDLLVIASTLDKAFDPALARALPLTFDASGLHLHPPVGLLARLTSAWARLTRSAWTPGQRETPDAMLEGIASPWHAGRSVVVLVLRNDDMARPFTQALIDDAQTSEIEGSVSLLKQGVFTSRSVRSSTYTIGSLTCYATLRDWLNGHTWVLFLATVACCLWAGNIARDTLRRVAAARLQVDSAAAGS